VTQYTYDALGNTRQVILPSGTQIDYLVDGEGHRIWKKVGTNIIQGFVYGNSLRVAAELNGAGAVISRFIYGDKRNVPDVMIKGGVTYRIVTDRLGSPRLVVNSSTGVAAQQMDYDEFGNIVQDSNPGFQPFGFAGGLYDVDTKLVRFGSRDYDASVGRWTAKDPLHFGGGDTSLYQYVGSDPVNFTDPLGLYVEICHKATTDIPGLGVFHHYWVATDRMEVGMGGDNAWTTFYEDEGGMSKHPDSECDVFPDADQVCVEDKLSHVGDSLGLWIPFFHDCKNFAQNVVNECIPVDPYLVYLPDSQPFPSNFTPSY
jgi:RHS repeat-associated protein